MFFSSYNTIPYDLGNGNISFVKDITQRVKIKSEIIDNIDYFDYYTIKDGESPEMVAHKIYDNVFYHWIILIANDIIDVKTDWPLGESEFNKYLEDKYGLHVPGIHHYVSPEGYVVDSTHSQAVPVTNYDYEVEVNDKKRDIKIPRREMLDTIVSQFEALIKQ